MRTRFKKGVTSIYVVVFTTLLLSIITVSFIGLVISEVYQTTESKLAQSAYDSALAGVEDAKLAIIAYNNCLNSTSSGVINNQAVDCAHIKDYMSNLSNNCNLVAWVLGRLNGPANSSDLSDAETGEVLVKETSDGTDASNETSQAYTCVMIKNILPDYRSSLSYDSSIRIIPLKSSEAFSGIRISWYSDSYGNEYVYTNVNGSSVSFNSLDNVSQAAAPPTITAQIIQTDSLFTLSSFDNISGSSTNTGTVFLVPRERGSNNLANHINSNNGFLNGNNKNTKNEGHLVNCKNRGDSDSSEFACSVSLALPTPVQKYDPSDPDTIRNPDTTFLVLTLPYGQPDTDFSIELCKADRDGSVIGDCIDESGEQSIVDFANVQSRIDSTGRANDIFSRVDARVELTDIYFPFVPYAAQINNQSNQTAIEKNFWVTRTNCQKTNQAGVVSGCNTSGEL